MNAQQRKFLIDKITERTKNQIELLKKSIPESISLNVYMLHKVMSNDFKIKSTEELKKVVLEKAIQSGQKEAVREDWLGNAWGSSHRGGVWFNIKDFFIVPEEYLQMEREREKQKQEVWDKIGELNIKLETLEIRIMLASDKVLQSIVNEVDDMGDINLIDTKIKLITT